MQIKKIAPIKMRVLMQSGTNRRKAGFEVILSIKMNDIGDDGLLLYARFIINP